VCRSLKARILKPRAEYDPGWQEGKKGKGCKGKGG
jgi:hypothetical protein